MQYYNILANHSFWRGEGDGGAIEVGSDDHDSFSEPSGESKTEFVASGHLTSQNVWSHVFAK